MGPGFGANGGKMLVFWKARLVFLANTRAGSTSIEQALDPLASLVLSRPPALKHTDARRYRAFVAPFLESAAPAGARFETLALIRQPRDWLGSWYRRDRRAAEDLPGDGTFAAYAEAYLAGALAHQSQADFLTDDAGALAVDHLFRFEDMARVVDFLDDRLGCAITLPHLDSAPAAALDLPGALAMRLDQAMAPDFSLYAAVAPLPDPPR